MHLSDAILHVKKAPAYAKDPDGGVDKMVGFVHRIFIGFCKMLDTQRRNGRIVVKDGSDPLNEINRAWGLDFNPTANTVTLFMDKMLFRQCVLCETIDDRTEGMRSKTCMNPKCGVTTTDSAGKEVFTPTVLDNNGEYGSVFRNVDSQPHFTKNPELTYASKALLVDELLKHKPKFNNISNDQFETWEDQFISTKSQNGPVDLQWRESDNAIMKTNLRKLINQFELDLQNMNRVQFMAKYCKNGPMTVVDSTESKAITPNAGGVPDAAALGEQQAEKQPEAAGSAGDES